MNQGYIKLHRQILDWDWYDDINTFRVFIHILLKANFKDKNWRGILIKRGEILTSRDHLAEDVGISVQQLRTCLSKLESTNEITITTTNRNTVIKICKYDSYQFLENESNQPDNQPTTNDQPASNQQVTTTKERKKVITSIIDREADFKKSLQPYLKKYGKDTLNDFYLYWTEKNKTGTKMLFEMKKTFDVGRRLATWKRNNFNSNNNQQDQPIKPKKLEY